MELLDNLKQTNARLVHLRERYTALETRLGPHSADLTETKVKTSPTDKASLLLAVLADVSVEIDSIEHDKEGLVTELSDKMRAAELTPDETIVMRLRYIYGAKWYDISDAMYLSPRYVYKIHGEALEKIRAV